MSKILDEKISADSALIDEDVETDTEEILYDDEVVGIDDYLSGKITLNELNEMNI
jgi:hypothetical protein